MTLALVGANRNRYVGAEDGIHEFHVNISGRKKFPSLVLR
jgi:hypothetical protein